MKMVQLKQLLNNTEQRTIKLHHIVDIGIPETTKGKIFINATADLIIGVKTNAQKQYSEYTE